MHIVIVGCGRVGSELARLLDDEGHSVAIIDRNGAALRKRLGEGFSGRLVTGSGFDRDVLDAAGVSEADGFVAVTSGDNTNIVAARIARETYEIPNVVARIYDPRRATLYQRLGIPTVATVAWTTDQVMRKLLPGDAAPVWSDPLGGVNLLQSPVPENWAGHKVRSFDERDKFSVVAITRDAATVLACDDLIFQEGDVVFVLVHAGATDAYQARLAGEGTS
ncbi:MAG TPA: TrkA family potassium uptake protein [Acidimicrobiales bacterium]|nr:TrkA family potassium uptake protein [Acidimicrobiales bacterium]